MKSLTPYKVPHRVSNSRALKYQDSGSLKLYHPVQGFSDPLKTKVKE